ncbi:MAG: helix-turn-helix domain-containing protein [Rhodopila sp.]
MLHEHKSKLADHHIMVSTRSHIADEIPAAAHSGATLRAARERVGWNLADIAASLRISLNHLEALEEGRITALPGNAYAVGYVRSYARAVGLDAEEMVRRFKAEAAEVAAKTDLSFPVPMPERGLPAGAVMLVGVVLCVIAYAGWYHLSGEGRLPAETVPPIPERLAPLAQQALPLPPAPVVAAAKPDAPEPAAAANVAAADPAPAVPPISPSSAAAALVREPVADSAQRSIGGGIGAPDKAHIVLHAVVDAWIQVKDRSGALLLNRVLKAGETWPAPKGDLVMTTGNAGGTEILVDGVVLPPLGGAGAVRRDVALDPAVLGGGKPVAPPPQATAMRGHQ